MTKAGWMLVIGGVILGVFGIAFQGGPTVASFWFTAAAFITVALAIPAGLFMLTLRLQGTARHLVRGLLLASFGFFTGFVAYVLSGGGMSMAHIDGPLYVPLSIWTYVGLFLLFPGGLLWSAGGLIAWVIGSFRRLSAS